jgi:DNA-binding NtrC family response regulator
MRRRVSRREFLVGVTAAIATAVAGQTASASSIAARPRATATRLSALDEIVGESPAIATLRETARAMLERIAGLRHAPPIWIFGETGAGKSIVGRALHWASPRANGPRIPVCLATLPECQIEPELFGIESGGCRGKGRASPGLFRSAHKGTLELDEVECLSDAVLRKLACAIDTRSLRRLGFAGHDPVDVWTIIASTPRPSWDPCGRSAESLYRRLDPIQLAVPPLRERGDDVLLLADRLLAQYCRDYGVPRKTLSSAAEAALHNYSWPGNLRELCNVIQRTVVLCDSRRLQTEDLGLSV